MSYKYEMKSNLGNTDTMFGTTKCGYPCAMNNELNGEASTYLVDIHGTGIM